MIHKLNHLKLTVRRIDTRWNEKPHWREVSCKLAEFLVSLTVKYCLVLYVSRMLLSRSPRQQLGRRGTTMSSGLSCFAHWYSRYFQLTGSWCVYRSAISPYFSNRLFPLPVRYLLSPLSPPLSKYFLLYIRCIRHAIVDSSFAIARTILGK